MNEFFDCEIAVVAVRYLNGKNRDLPPYDGGFN